MSTEDNKSFIRQRFEAAWNSNNSAALDELYSPDNIHHSGSTTGRLGPNEMRGMIKAWRDAIPDYRCSIENVVAEGDTVAVLLQFSGTHTSAPLTVSSRTAQPKNRRFSESEMIMFKLKNGKVVESWATWDRLNFLEQLGALDRQAE
jgi:predicted ester cyclase